MPTIPKSVKMTASPQAVVSAVFADNPNVFANTPTIANTSESIRAIGDYICTY